MSARTTTISLTVAERELINKVADELFGTTEVPYGVTIQRLAKESTSIDVDAAVAESA